MNNQSGGLPPLPPQQQQMGGGPGGGPAWANPNPQPLQATQQEEEFFAPLSTLDEPIMETIMRDVRAVSSKLKVVMLPLDSAVRTTLISGPISCSEVLVFCCCCEVGWSENLQ